MVKFIVLILVLMTIVCSLLWFLTEDWRYERRKKHTKMILRPATVDGIKGGILYGPNQPSIFVTTIEELLMELNGKVTDITIDLGSF